MTTVYFRNHAVDLDGLKTLGDGGEAVVYALDADTALKIFRQPGDAYYRDIPDAEQRKRDQLGAAERLDLMQEKLKAFPKAWSPRVIIPHETVTNRGGAKILGYGMPIVQQAVVMRNLSRRKTRPPGVDNNAIVQIFRDLRGTIDATHKAQVVVGDFNYFNVLVQLAKRWAFLIDADSMSVGKFPCRTFTPNFVDPLICDPSLERLVQNRPHTSDTDWYAFALMLFETMMFTPLYGGVYEPGKGGTFVKLDSRPHQRISVLHPKVLYPAVGVPLKSLPDDLLHYYAELVGKDKRGEFPAKLLFNLRWVICPNCGVEHAKIRCPSCDHAVAPASVRETVRGKVRVVRVFDTAGVILRAAISGGVLHYLVHKDGIFSHAVSSYDAAKKLMPPPRVDEFERGDLLPEMRFGIQGPRSVIAAGSELRLYEPGNTSPQTTSVERYRDQYPVFAANSSHLYWGEQGELQRTDGGSAKRIGSILPNETQFWMGPKFGFGWYRVGAVQIAFVFDAEKSGINDEVKLPPIRGQILEANCSFDDHRCWFFVTARDGNKVMNHVFVIAADGRVAATESVEETSTSWLNDIGRGVAVTLPASSGGTVHVLFAATDEGVVRIHETQGFLVEAARFPDTRGFVDSGYELLLGKDGLYAVNRREIKLIQLLP